MNRQLPPFRALLFILKLQDSSAKSPKEISVSVQQKETNHFTEKTRGEVYWYMGLYEFDVDLARDLVQDGRESVEVDDDSVRTSVAGSEINKSHIARVDPSIP